MCCRGVTSLSVFGLTGHWLTFQLTVGRRPYYGGGILKESFHSENVSNVYHPHEAGEI